MGLSTRIKRLPVDALWKGPKVDGITQSLLGGFLNCPHRFYIKTILGLRPVPQFSHALEYGNMWHICEESLAAEKSWKPDLIDYCVKLQLEYPESRQEIEKWYNICLIQFPVYIDYWKDHRDVKNRVPIFQEVCFKVSYKLPSGRTVTLRGKWDSVDEIENGIWLQENKTKGDINLLQLKDQLPHTLQPLFYLIALQIHGVDKPVKGIRYNVVKRPCSGGKHSIKQHKGRQTKQGIKGAETSTQFYERLGSLIAENGDDFFSRWKALINKSDIAQFKKEILDPILENLCDWWEWADYSNREGFSFFDAEIRQEVFPKHCPHVHRLPYGIWNPVNEGNDVLGEYILTGSKAGLVRAKTLFPELQSD